VLIFEDIAYFDLTKKRVSG